MNLNQNIDEDKFEIQIKSLIDVVFLFAYLFMVTTTLIKKEADIGFICPVNISVEEMKDIPRLALEIQRDGTIEIEGMRFSNDDRDLNDLVITLKGIKRNCS